MPSPLPLALLALAGAALADETEARTCIRAKVHEAYGQGWNIRTSTTATLAKGELDVYALTLQQGNTYRVLACGDAQLADVGLFVYDADGAIVVQEQATDREPSLELTPATSGKYYVVVQAAATAGGAAKGSVATAVTYK